MQGKTLGSVTALRFEGFTVGMLAIESDCVHHGRGAEDFASAVNGLTAIATVLAETDEALRAELSALSVEWEGDSGSAAGGSVQKHAEYAEHTRAKAQDAGRNGTVLLEAFDTLKRNMPTADTLKAGEEGLGVGDILAGLVGHETSHAQKVRESRAARDQAIDALNSYRKTCIAELENLRVPDPVDGIELDDPATAVPGKGRPQKFGSPENSGFDGLLGNPGEQQPSGFRPGSDSSSPWDSFSDGFGPEVSSPTGGYDPAKSTSPSDTASAPHSSGPEHARPSSDSSSSGSPAPRPPAHSGESSSAPTHHAPSETATSNVDSGVSSGATSGTGTAAPPSSSSPTSSPGAGGAVPPGVIAGGPVGAPGSNSGSPGAGRAPSGPGAPAAGPGSAPGSNTGSGIRPGSSGFGGPGSPSDLARGSGASGGSPGGGAAGGGSTGGQPPGNVGRGFGGSVPTTGGPGFPGTPPTPQTPGTPGLTPGTPPNTPGTPGSPGNPVAPEVPKGKITGIAPPPATDFGPAPGAGPAVGGAPAGNAAAGAVGAAAAAMGAGGATGAAQRDNEHRSDDRYHRNQYLTEMEVGEIPGEDEARHADDIAPETAADQPQYLEQAAPDTSGDRVRTHGIDHVDLFTDDRLVSRDVIDDAPEGNASGQAYGAGNEEAGKDGVE